MVPNTDRVDAAGGPAPGSTGVAIPKRLFGIRPAALVR